MVEKIATIDKKDNVEDKADSEVDSEITLEQIKLFSKKIVDDYLNKESNKNKKNILSNIIKYSDEYLDIKTDVEKAIDEFEAIKDTIEFENFSKVKNVIDRVLKLYENIYREFKLKELDKMIKVSDNYFNNKENLRKKNFLIELDFILSDAQTYSKRECLAILGIPLEEYNYQFKKNPAEVERIIHKQEISKTISEIIRVQDILQPTADEIKKMRKKYALSIEDVYNKKISVAFNNLRRYIIDNDAHIDEIDAVLNSQNILETIISALVLIYNYSIATSTLDLYFMRANSKRLQKIIKINNKRIERGKRLKEKIEISREQYKKIELDKQILSTEIETLESRKTLLEKQIGQLEGRKKLNKKLYNNESDDGETKNNDLASNIAKDLLLDDIDSSDENEDNDLDEEPENDMPVL